MLVRDSLYCPFCFRHKPKTDFAVIVANSGFQMCGNCFEHHNKILDTFSGRPPPQECAHCETPFVVGADCYLIQVEGIYVLLCKPCSDEYARKRKDRFRATPYGEAEGI